MFSKGQQIQFLTKSTFKLSSPLVPLIDQLFVMIPLLRELLGRNIFDQFDHKEIKLLCFSLPKPIERNQHTLKELQICQELKAVIEDFAKSKRNRKYKPYNLLLLWKSFEAIIVSRIRSGLRGKLDSAAEDPKKVKLFSLVKEIEDTTSLFYEWAQQHSGKSKPLKKDGVEFVYPKSTSKTDEKTNRITIDSTAAASGKFSKVDRGSTFEDIKQFNKASPQCNLFRASTAKMEKKPIKMNVRCPSAVHVLKNQQFKKPQFELRNSKRKRTKYGTHQTKQMGKTIDEGLSNFDFDSSKMKKTNFQTFFLTKKSSKKLQRDKIKERNKNNVSILEREFCENEESGSSKHSDDEFLSIKLLQERESEMVAASKTNSQVQVGRKNGNTRTEDENIEYQEYLDQQEKEESSPSGQNLSPNGQSEVAVKSQSQVTSEHSSDINDDLLFKIKQKRVKIKTSKRSGQFFSPDDSWVKACQLNQTKKSCEAIKSKESIKSRRRVALISSKKLTNNQLSDEDLPCAAKTLEFDQNVLLAAENASRKKRTEYPSKVKNEIPTTASFNNFFSELNSFISREQFFYQENYGSIFFRQQRKLKDYQDQAIREKLKHLMLDNRHMSSNIFEMTNNTSLNKDVIYSQIHRGEAFTSDKEWIRHNFQSGDSLAQKSL